MFNLNFTTSKVFAFLVLTASVIVSLVLKSSECFIVGVGFSCGLMGLKSYTTASLKKLDMNKTNENDSNS